MLEITETPKIIGRGERCDLVLQDSSVSSSHAEVILRGGEAWIRDLNSTNGTWVNGDKVSREVKIKPGDRVEFGDVILQLAGTHLVEAPPEAPRTEIRHRESTGGSSDSTNPSGPRVNQQYVQTGAESSAGIPPSPKAETTTGSAPAKGFAVAGLVCGLVAFLLLPIVLGPLGIIFGAVSWSKGNKLGMAATIVSICGLVIGMILGYIVWAA